MTDRSLMIELGLALLTTLLLIIGGSMEDFNNPIVVEDKWIDADRSFRTVSANESNQNVNYPVERKELYNDDWKSHKNDDSQRWRDFLEELEHRGFSVYDPEAAEIWEEFE